MRKIIAKNAHDSAVTSHSLNQGVKPASVQASLPAAGAGDDALLARREQFLQIESEWLHRTISYQIGNAILDATHSLSGLWRLPGRLLAIHREARSRRLARLGGGRSGGAQQLAWEIAAAWPSLTVERALARIGARQGTPALAALTAHETARILIDYDPGAALRFGEHAYLLNPTPQVGKWLAFAHHKSGNVTAAAALLARPDIAASVLRANEIRTWSVVRDNARLLAQLPPLPARACPPPRRPGPLRVLYVVSALTPTHTSGYAIRSHALARALGQRDDLEVSVVTRPGYPWDRRDALGPLTPERVVRVDGLAYDRIPCEVGHGEALSDYMGHASTALEQYAAARDIDVVVAASNHVNALPALLAARRLGCAFIYEVRGFWELTAAARHPSLLQSERFRLQRSLEMLVATHADAVLTLTTGLRQVLCEGGVDPRKVGLVPNAVDAERFPAQGRDEALAQALGVPAERVMLGFVGSLEHYEGLGPLLSVLRELLDEGLDLGLIVVGDGRQRAELAQQVIRLGLSARVVFAGRVPAEAVARYYSLVDIAPFPRLPLEVCELVSPIKPMEAMAMGKAVLVSSVQALRDIVDDGATGLVFEKGNARALAAALRRLAVDGALRRSLGERAHAEVTAAFTWRQRAAEVARWAEHVSAEREEAPALVRQAGA